MKPKTTCRRRGSIAFVSFKAWIETSLNIKKIIIKQAKAYKPITITLLTRWSMHSQKTRITTKKIDNYWRNFDHRYKTGKFSKRQYYHYIKQDRKEAKESFQNNTPKWAKSVFLLPNQKLNPVSDKSEFSKS